MIQNLIVLLGFVLIIINFGSNCFINISYLFGYDVISCGLILLRGEVIKLKVYRQEFNYYFILY
uniref:Uncharacterized protein n=1 Tax=Glossina morsitans morsitans TaxID=37546 RepID=A0A1B0GEM3_GLOMM